MEWPIFKANIRRTMWPAKYLEVMEAAIAEASSSRGRQQSQRQA